MGKDNLLKKAFDYASRRALSAHIDEEYMLAGLRTHMRAYLDEYDKNVTDEEINYYIKEQMKGYRAIQSRSTIHKLNKK